MDLLEQDSKRFIDNLFLAGIAISASISMLTLSLTDYGIFTFSTNALDDSQSYCL